MFARDITCFGSIVCIIGVITLRHCLSPRPLQTLEICHDIVCPGINVNGGFYTYTYVLYRNNNNCCAYITGVRRRMSPEKIYTVSYNNGSFRRNFIHIHCTDNTMRVAPLAYRYDVCGMQRASCSSTSTRLMKTIKISKIMITIIIIMIIISTITERIRHRDVRTLDRSGEIRSIQSGFESGELSRINKLNILTWDHGDSNECSLQDLVNATNREPQ